MSKYRPPTPGPVSRRSKNEDAPPEILWRIPTLFPKLKDVEPTLRGYFDQLNIFNKTLNLIGPGSMANADLLHFADAIYASQIIHGQINDEPIYDIGSGNGIPGLVYAILFPKAPVFLVEHDQRKAEFLRTVASRLKLSNVQVIVKSFEQIPAETIRFAMARGFASIPKTLFLARKIMQKDGKFFHIKGSEWPLEIGEMPTQLCSYWSSGLVSGYSLEELAIQYFVVASQRIK